MCETYQCVSVFLADNQGFEGSDRDSGTSSAYVVGGKAEACGPRSILV